MQLTKKQILDQVKMLSELPEDDMEAISEEFNAALVETKIWHKYDVLNKSYEKYKNDEGWANALFHYFDYDREDWANWEEWIKMVYQKESELYNETTQKES